MNGGGGAGTGAAAAIGRAITRGVRREAFGVICSAGLVKLWLSLGHG